MTHSYSAARQRELDKLAAVCKARGLTIDDYNKMQNRVGTDAKGNGCVLWNDFTTSESLTVWDLADEYIAAIRLQPTAAVEKPTSSAPAPQVDLKAIFGAASSPKEAQRFVATHGIAAYRELRVKAEAAGLV